ASNPPQAQPHQYRRGGSKRGACSVVGSRSIPPSSPMVSTANNPNKAEIPDRRKDINATT
ncbi:hypothetical protein M9458_030411, partial [Cirrhinus mrigala]